MRKPENIQLAMQMVIAREYLPRRYEIREVSILLLNIVGSETIRLSGFYLHNNTQQILVISFTDYLIMKKNEWYV